MPVGSQRGSGDSSAGRGLYDHSYGCGGEYSGNIPCGDKDIFRGGGEYNKGSVFCGQSRAARREIRNRITAAFIKGGKRC